MLAARNATPVAIASRDRERAQRTADAHGVATVHGSYDELLADPSLDAVYIALANHLHHHWTLRALAAGKHVLCEKPLGCSGAEVRDMARAAHAAKRTLMEAFMYRFHPRMRRLRDRLDDVRHVHAAFAFSLNQKDGYRMHPDFGGGALLDVGCYTLDVARWFCGEPRRVAAVVSGEPVDLSVAAALEFDGGRSATVWASFVAPEHQALTIVSRHGVEHLAQPFTAWRDPDDPYQLMVEAFASSVLQGAPPPLSLDDSLATADLIDRVRSAAAEAR